MFIPQPPSILQFQKIKAEMKELINKRLEWREKRFFDHVKGKEEEDEGRRGRIRHHRAETIAEQNKNMKRFIFLKLEGMLAFTSVGSLFTCDHRSNKHDF